MPKPWPLLTGFLLGSLQALWPWKKSTEPATTRTPTGGKRGLKPMRGPSAESADIMLPCAAFCCFGYVGGNRGEPLGKLHVNGHSMRRLRPSRQIACNTPIHKPYSRKSLHRNRSKMRPTLCLNCLTWPIGAPGLKHKLDIRKERSWD